MAGRLLPVLLIASQEVSLGTPLVLLCEVSRVITQVVLAQVG